MDSEVIIIGGGPVGMALAIELGMLGVRVLVIEKHGAPQMLPKAQLLNPRSMEFFRRWRISEKLKSKRLLPSDFPIRATWCSALNGEAYASVEVADNVNNQIAAENYLRIPLWITEEVMRERLRDFQCVRLIKNSEVVNVEQDSKGVAVTIRNRENQEVILATSSYAVACDGANSRTRNIIGIDMQTELPPSRFINILFTSTELKEKMTLPLSMLYYNLSSQRPAAFGYVDYNKALWYASISAPVDYAEVDHVSTYLDHAAGFVFDKIIHQNNFWYQQAKIADTFQLNRIFLAGDAAHILPPTGAHGLNTGLIGAVNLAWKLALVLRGQAKSSLLTTYDLEMRPIALRNIHASKKNAEDAKNISQRYPQETMPQAFAEENQRIAKQHAISLGLALGYAYHHSPLLAEKTTSYSDDTHYYQPKAIPGYFAPHFSLDGKKCLYDNLLPSFTLLIKNNNEDISSIVAAFKNKDITLRCIDIRGYEYYTKKYYILRPDWHIAWSSNYMPMNADSLINILLGMA